jgi:hypothetical protein
MVLPLRGDDKTMYRRRTGAGGKSYAAPKRRSLLAAKVLAGCVGEGMGEAFGRKIGAEGAGERKRGRSSIVDCRASPHCSKGGRAGAADEIELAALSRSIAKSPDLVDSHPGCDGRDHAW